MQHVLQLGEMLRFFVSNLMYNVLHVLHVSLS